MKSEDQVINTFQNINVSVRVYDTMNDASKTQNSIFNESMITVSISGYFHIKYKNVFQRLH